MAPDASVNKFVNYLARSVNSFRCSSVRFGPVLTSSVDFLAKYPTILFQYTLNGRTISKVNSTKYLSVTISSNLNWNEHVDNIFKNANSTLGLLRRVLDGCSHKVTDVAYRTLVRPKLEYASCVWNPYRHQNINEIESVQRRGDMSLTTIRVIATLHLGYKVLALTHSITEVFFHKAPCFMKSIWAMLAYHFYLMSY